MNNEIYELFSTNFSTLRKTAAPDGRYLACSNILCVCCQEPITASKPILVKNGTIDRQSILIALRQLIECHPANAYLDSIEWDGGGSFTCTFSD